LTDGSSSFDPTDKISTAGAISDINSNGSTSGTSSTTTIDGGYIRTNTLEVETIKSGLTDFNGSAHTFGLATQGLQVGGTSYDATAIFKSTHNSQCAALFVENIGNSTDSVGIGAAVISGQAGAFAYGDDGQGSNDGQGGVYSSYGSLSDKFISIANATNLIEGSANGNQKFSINPSGNLQLDGTLRVDGGSITSTSGSITFGNENLSTTGTLASGALSVTGAITATGDVTAFFSSDKRLKDNIIPIENSLDKVMQLGGYEFDWNYLSPYKGMHDIGVIAQEVLKVAPEAVAKRENEMLAVRYEKLVPLLIEAIKELKEEIEELKRGSSN